MNGERPDQGPHTVRTVFKSDTTLRSHCRPNSVLKQDGVVYNIPCARLQITAGHRTFVR